MPIASFTQDNKTENWLRQHGVPFSYRQNIKFTELNKSWSVINQGRPDGVPTDDNLIEKYAYAMRESSAFPAVIVAQATDGLEVLDGIQRLMAAKLNDQTVFNAYVVDTNNPTVRMSIRVCANSLNGSSPSMDWTVSRVVDILHDTFGLSPGECAAWSCLPEAKIQQEIDARIGADWLRSKGIDMSVRPANQKGFLSVFSRRFNQVERERLSSQLPEIVIALQEMRATNPEAEEIFRECTDFKPRQDRDLGEQIEARFESLMERPEYKMRRASKRKMHPADNAITGIAGAVTRLRSAAKCKVELDAKQSAAVVQLFEEAKTLCRQIVPQEHWGSLAYGPRRE